MPGDPWILGNHRLICGNCTDPEIVARLLGDAKPLLLVITAESGCSHADFIASWAVRANAAVSMIALM